MEHYTMMKQKSQASSPCLMDKKAPNSNSNQWRKEMMNSSPISTSITKRLDSILSAMLEIIGTISKPSSTMR